MPTMLVDNEESIELFLNQIEKDTNLLDVELVSARDNEKVSAHRLLLSARSEYFRSKITSTPDCKKFKINGVNGKDLKNIINYLYSGIVELEAENAVSVLATAYLFKLPDLIKACGTFLENEINATNSLGLWTVAEKYNCENLLETSKRYACEHFVDVSQSHQFLALDNERLRELLACDELSFTSQDEIVLSLLRWFQHEQRARVKFVSGLVSLVRVPLLSSEFLSKQLPFICDVIKDAAFIEEIYKCHLKPTEQNSLMKEALLAVMIDHKGIQIQQYSNENNEWSTWTNLDSDQKRVTFGVALKDDELIIAGGYDGSKCVNTVRSTNLKTKVTKSLIPMEICRSSVALVVLDDDIYAAGGMESDRHWLRSVEKWNRSTESWSNVAPMIERRTLLRAAVLNGSIYVIGGDTKTMECYNPHTNAWTLKASMHEVHSWPGLAVLNNYLYAVEGLWKDTVERYDPKTDTWTRMYPLSLNGPTGRLGCIAMNDRIIAVDGVDSYTLEESDQTTYVWTPKSRLNIPGEFALVLAKNQCSPMLNSTEKRPKMNAMKLGLSSVGAFRILNTLLLFTNIFFKNGDDACPGPSAERSLVVYAHDTE